MTRYSATGIPSLVINVISAFHFKQIKATQASEVFPRTSHYMYRCTDKLISFRLANRVLARGNHAQCRQVCGKGGIDRTGESAAAGFSVSC